MAHQPKLVNKQFNSPIGLYSQQNIQEVLDRDLQVLTNGGVGINFYNPNVGKPANLHNSAVLRMIEEEKRHHSGSMKREGDIENYYKPQRRQPKWPPPQNERKRRFRSAFTDVVISGTKRIAWPPVENEDEEGVHTQAQKPPSTTPVNFKRPESKTTSISGTDRPVLQPLKIICNTPPGQQSPRSPALTHSPRGFGQSPSPKGWAPVHPPISPKGSPVSVPSYSSPVQCYSPGNQKLNSPQRALTPCHIPNKVKEPPPTTITLRPQAPVSQASPPVFTSQPATATLKGGKCLRGDMKWPPESVKKQAEEENRLRMELARGPVCRPRKVNKDYSGFFAQHALNSTYPGYKPPPGTQYYGESDY
ncbi:PDZ and LIM domain protein Zasp-like isoform X1 [Coccinella septempunctata]|uniref:PDZ and LIM domain protein Zasp-like isoform X1 n=1 Tax=Coccinella septempunctata TaxID=41139 RepID=UPI001D099AB0|nr:PDZ and LIM domain protein Zasp-like isoform X1 [Coccinella septempunctata]